VVLTGTDVYRDIDVSAGARHSLDLASALIALQDRAPARLPARWRRKCEVIYQSAHRLTPARRPVRSFDVVVVGHLRAEKDPLTAMRAAELLPAGSVARVLHLGAALQSSLARACRATAARCARYRWLGPLPRAQARQRMRRAHLLLHPSIMEGGAQVILEAIQAGTPVIASDCAGNVGMLGTDYAGLFPVGDAARAARLIDRAATDPDFYRRLARQCKKRASLFDSDRERKSVTRLVHNALHVAGRSPS
jgi:putative glycosyltransferase (TIGR04348 family)